MNRLLIALILSLASAVAWACSVNPLIHVFNDSRERVVVRVGNKVYVAEPSRQTSFVYKDADVAVQIGDRSVLYRIAFLPPGYRRTGWFRSHITFQIEPDRRVFVLKAHDMPPIEAASYEQPEGYPLVPSSDDTRGG